MELSVFSNFRYNSTRYLSIKYFTTLAVLLLGIDNVSIGIINSGFILVDFYSDVIEWYRSGIVFDW